MFSFPLRTPLFEVAAEKSRAGRKKFALEMHRAASPRRCSSWHKIFSVGRKRTLDSSALRTATALYALVQRGHTSPFLQTRRKINKQAVIECLSCSRCDIAALTGVVVLQSKSGARTKIQNFIKIYFAGIFCILTKGSGSPRRRPCLVP